MSAELTASDRLVLSRERLRQAMRDIVAPPDRAAKQRTGGSAVGLERLKSTPGASVVVEAVSRWWEQHPLRIAGMLAADLVKAVIQPVARRNPLGLVLGAAVLGGLLVWVRPWRWIPKPVLFAGLLPQLVSTVMAQVPPRSWMAVLTSLVQQQRRSKEPDGASRRQNS